MKDMPRTVSPLLLFACLLAFLLSASALGQSTAPRVTVWLDRPAVDNFGSAMPLYVDGKKMVSWGPSQYFGIQLSPGLHAFSWTNAPGARQVVLSIAADAQSYLEVKYLSVAPFLAVSPLPADNALAAMTGLRPIDSNAAFGDGIIIPAQRLEIPGTAALNESETSRATAPAPKAVDPAPAIAILPSASAPRPPANAAATFTSDGEKLRELRTTLEGEEGLNSPRPFEVFWAPGSISRWGQMNLYGGELEVAVKVTDHLSFIADVGDHRSINGAVTTGSGFLTSGRVETLTYRFGPKFSIRPNERLTIFGHAAAGRTRVKGKYDFGDGFTLDALGNGLVISGGGGVDLAVKKWLGIRIVQSEYSHNRIEGGTWHDLRVGSGLVFRVK